jgi:hypothetical protein
VSAGVQPPGPSAPAAKSAYVGTSPLMDAVLTTDAAGERQRTDLNRDPRRMSHRSEMVELGWHLRWLENHRHRWLSSLDGEGS